MKENKVNMISRSEYEKMIRCGWPIRDGNPDATTGVSDRVIDLSLIHI